jgi:hypothetical protein
MCHKEELIPKPLETTVQRGGATNRKKEATVCKQTVASLSTSKL